jgi:hypothetical protein
MIEVDVDSDAERVMIIDRTTGALLYHSFTNSSGFFKKVVPLKYSLANNIMVGILDDDGVYNCAFIDGVRAESVDANTINMSQ